jgi:hypothetical protein
MKTYFEEIKYIPYEKIKEPETPKFEIVHGETIEDRKSTFQAHLADITSRDQVDQVLTELKKDRKIAKATYNMWACRVFDEKKETYLEDGKDDGENLGGERLLHLLQRSDAKNVVIIVTRWHGGIHIGNDRFKHINKCASDLLQSRRQAETSKTSADPKDTKGKGKSKSKQKKSELVYVRFTYVYKSPSQLSQKGALPVCIHGQLSVSKNLMFQMTVVKGPFKTFLNSRN